MYARVPQAMAQFFLKIEKLSHIMGPTPISEMARAYGLRPRLWLLVQYHTVSGQIVSGTLNHAIYDVYSPKAVKRLMYLTFMNILRFIYHKICCPFVLLKPVWFDAIMSFMECVDVATFSWAACWIRTCLFWTFISPGATVIDLTVIFPVFFVFLDKRSVVLFYWSEFRDRVGIKYLQAKQNTSESARITSLVGE